MSFLQDEKTAYDAIAGDVKIIWEKLVDQNAVQSNMIQALACLSKLRVACSPGEAMLMKDRESAEGGAEMRSKDEDRDGNVNEELEECPICMEPMEDPTITACKHILKTMKLKGIEGPLHSRCQKQTSL